MSSIANLGGINNVMTRELKYIDTHSHIHFEDFDVDRAEMSDRMSDNNVGTIAIGTDIETSKQVVELANSEENVWASIGIHPNTSDDSTALKPSILGTGDISKVVAIGECGLDYFRSDGGDKREVARQKESFRVQIELAIEYKLPLMLHIRSNNDEAGQSTNDAHNDALEILGEYKKKHGDALKFHCHFTTFGIEIAKKFIEIDEGVTFGIPGVVTYKSAQDLQDLVKWLPLEKILSETDAPYAAPVPHRGKRNEPLFVIDIVKAIADLRGEDREMVRKQLMENAKIVFGLGNYYV